MNESYSIYIQPYIDEIDPHQCDFLARFESLSAAYQYYAHKIETLQGKFKRPCYLVLWEDSAIKLNGGPISWTRLTSGLEVFDDR